METKLLYLEHMDQYTCEVRVVGVLVEDGKTAVLLDQIVFYPQGGGQPYDTGTISSADGKKFLVEEVRYADGVVRHSGNFDGEPFNVDQTVSCALDIERRKLHARLHSAGHVLDMGVKQLKMSWIPGKGYHFPNGPYVEYGGSLNGIDIEKLKMDLEAACNQIIKKGIATKVLFMPKEEMGSVCEFVPHYIPEGKPGRVVMYGDFGVPCGGTHVSNLNEIVKMTIRKIKRDGENIRVAYAV